MKNALSYAWKLLGRRSLTTSEMEQKLVKKGYQRDTVVAVISYLHERCYLDDRQFTRSWISRRCRERPVGRCLIIRELKAKGLAGPMIITELEALYPVELEQELALLLAQKKWVAGVADKKYPERIARHLQRKGFAFSVIKQVLDQLQALSSDSAATLTEDGIIAGQEFLDNLCKR